MLIGHIALKTWSFQVILPCPSLNAPTALNMPPPSNKQNIKYFIDLWDMAKWKKAYMATDNQIDVKSNGFN